MSQKIDIRYLCLQIGNSTGLPIRYFEHNDLVFYHSLAVFPVDPFLLYQKDIFAIDHHVGYFITPRDEYYGILNFGVGKLVIGPTRHIPLAEQEIREIALEADVPAALVPAFVAARQSIAPIPLMSLLQTMSILNHFLNDYETLSLPDIAIVESTQKKIIEGLRADDVGITVKRLDGIEESAVKHNTNDVEAYMLGLVQKGDVEGLQQFFAEIPAMQEGVMAQNSTRQAQNLLVVTVTLVSRAAIRGGMDPEDALSLSDRYVQKSELLCDVGAVTNLNYRMILDYAEQVRALRFGCAPTQLVVEVTNYIRHHLSDVITVEGMAQALCRGRSRLSTDFKKETGENLSDYIARKKIQEGKKLLRFTTRSTGDIAAYLGFSSQSHFIRVFKKFEGATPNAYRRMR